MPARKVLVVDQARQWMDARAGNPDIVARVVSTFSDAVQELFSAGYEAVFLRVEDPGELSLIVRLKGVLPETPVVALIPERRPSLDTLARGSGADDVLPMPATALTADLLSRVDAAIGRARRLRDETRVAIEGSRRTIAQSFALADIPVDRLVPLLIDDDLNYAFFTRRAFRGLNLPYPLPALDSGEKAVAYLEISPAPVPSLILLDVRMYAMSGFEVLKWIRERPRFADTTVFMLSTSWRPGDVETSLALGADHAFLKPSNLEGLTDATRVMVARWALLQKSRRAPEAPGAIS